MTEVTVPSACAPSRVQAGGCTPAASSSSSGWPGTRTPSAVACATPLRTVPLIQPDAIQGGRSRDRTCPAAGPGGHSADSFHERPAEDGELESQRLRAHPASNRGPASRWLHLPGAESGLLESHALADTIRLATGPGAPVRFTLHAYAGRGSNPHVTKDTGSWDRRVCHSATSAYTGSALPLSYQPPGPGSLILRPGGDRTRDLSPRADTGNRTRALTMAR